MRLVSDLDNPDSDVCVDLNGFQVCCYLCVCMCLCVFTCAGGGRGMRKRDTDRGRHSSTYIYSPSSELSPLKGTVNAATQQTMYVFQMTRKQWRGKQLIQGNFHPANTMAFIDDNHRSRLTLVMAQAHGLASLNFGTCWYNTFCSAVHFRFASSCLCTHLFNDRF